MQTTKHIPVMLEQSINGMNIQKKGIYIDATYGFGGHSNKILSLLDDEGRLFAVDKDINSIKVAEKALPDDKRFSLKHGCFSSLGDYSKEWGIYGAVNGILFDLGVSSEHLDNPERGFSFRQNGPIDMRFDQSCGLSACEWIDSVDEETLYKVIKRYGEERYSKRIAREIIYHREKEKINNTHDLVKVIDRAIPKNEKNKHNATRTFQAIRIFINNELEILKEALQNSYNILAPKGRLVLITYHSLEDRVIKDFLTYTDKSLSAPRDLPLKNEFLTKMYNLVVKSMKPHDAEISSNPRSRSAKLNILEKANEDYV